MVSVKDHKANTSLTALNLQFNKVGDNGATALADALKAAVLTCKKCVFRALFGVTANVASQSRLKSWRRQLVVQCALRLLCFFVVRRDSLF